MYYLDHKNIEKIEEIIDILEGKKNPNPESEYKKIHEETVGKSKFYGVLFENNEYFFYYPPSKILENGKITNIYTNNQLIDLMVPLINANKYLKISNTNTIYSIHDSEEKILQEFQFGIEYELIQKDDTKENISYKYFLEATLFNQNFPKNIKFYSLYCKNTINNNNFIYLNNDKRDNFESFIYNFITQDYKNVEFIAGNRGIGKTTTILQYFQKINCPYFYINLRYFEKSNNALECSMMIDEEKKNLLRRDFLEYLSLSSLKNINYENEFYISFKEIENPKFDNINNIVELNDYIWLIIKIIFLIYNCLILKEDKKEELKEEININIKEKINKIIQKIKQLSLPDSVIKNDYYNSDYLINKNNLYRLLGILKNYRAYNYYLLLNAKIPEYKSYEIWNFIEALLKRCKEINLKFVLILDQYKNLNKQETKLNELINEYKTSKILICSSIDDYKIRYSLLIGNPKYNLFQKYFVDYEDIGKLIDIKNYSDKKNNVFYLFKNNLKEIFECIKEDDNNLNEYLNKKIDKIQNYFNLFCHYNNLNTFYSIYIYKNINNYWEYKDFYKIMKYISFKYFTYEKIDKNNPMFQDINNYKHIKQLKLEHKSDDTEKKNEKEEEKEKYYYKFDYSIPIAENSLSKFIKDENNIFIYEKIIQKINEDSGKNDIFKEYVKIKIRKKEMTPIKDLIIDENIEIWSLFSHPSKNIQYL